MAPAKVRGNTRVRGAPPEPIPTMVADRDVTQVAELVASLGDGATVLEFGPWLGALSAVIAPGAKLHVVDCFQWTADHEKRVPGLLSPGESFRAAFEANLTARGLSATVHEAQFADFEWTGGPLDLVVIDGPKRARDLAPCLATAMPALAPGARVVVKNGLHPAHPDIAGLLEALMEADAARLTDSQVEAGSNVLCFGAGSDLDRAAPILADAADAAAGPGPSEAFVEALGLAPDHPFRFAPLRAALDGGEVRRAYDLLSRMPRDRALRRAWEKRPPDPKGADVSDAELQTFADMVTIHHTAIAKEIPEPFHASPERLFRGYWLNNAERPERGLDFWPEALIRAHEYGYVHWPGKIRAMAYDKDVIDVGCGPGLHGIGYLAAGARSYLGVDPIITMRKDRVKDLIRGGKRAFGWTPEEIGRRLSRWEVRPLSVAEIGDERQFDLATLHNVTEHLLDLEGAFRQIARILRDGGRILYNHHNYYSWNGHHCAPKSVQAYDAKDPDQEVLVDWRHIDFDPPPEHYIARGLNRMRLDDVIALTEKYFVIEETDERLSAAAVGGDRLTDEIRARHPDLTERDFRVQNLLCVARVKR